MSVGTRGVVEVVITAAIAAVMTLAYVVVAGRLLGPPEYSDFGAALSVVYFAGLALSPLTPAVSRMCAMYAAKNDDRSIASLRAQLLVRFAGTVSVPFVIVAAAAVPIARAMNFRTPASLILALLIAVLYAILSIDRGVAHGLFLFRVHNANTLIETGLRLVCGMAFLFAIRRSAPVALAAYAAAMIAAELALAAYFAPRLPAPGERTAVDWPELRRLLVPISVLMAAVAVFQNADMLIVKRSFSADLSGAYAAATTLARCIGVLFAPLYIVINPVLARLHQQRLPVAGAALRLTGAFLAISLPAVAIMAVWPRLIVRLLYGPSYDAAVPLLAPLGGVLIVTYCGLMLAQALITIGRNGFLVPYAIVAVVQVVVLMQFHASFRQLFAALYACQIAALALVVLTFLNSQKIRRDGNNSSIA